MHNPNIIEVISYIREKQFTIIRELLRTNDRIGMLNEAEKRSLEFLKDGKKRISMSPG